MDEELNIEEMVARLRAETAQSIAQLEELARGLGLFYKRLAEYMPEDHALELCKVELNALASASQSQQMMKQFIEWMQGQQGGDE